MNKEISFSSPVLLALDHRIDQFDCGQLDLNWYLKKFALTNNQNRSAGTFVTLQKKEVVGFYTLTIGSIEREKTPQRILKGLVNHPIPVFILARLEEKEF